MTDDAQLLHAWRNGDSRAGERLFQRYYGAVTRFFATKITGPSTDLVQETFMACVQGRDRIDDASRFRSYLFSVAYNVLKGHLRRMYRQPEDPCSSSVHDLSPGPSTMMRLSEQKKLLLSALRRIPVPLQTALELRYWEKLDSTEIARVLGVPASTVRSRLSRARALLEEALLAEPTDAALGQRVVGDLDTWAERLRQDMMAPPT